MIEFKDKDGIQKIESLGFSVGYRWAEMCEKDDFHSFVDRKSKTLRGTVYGK